MVSESSPPEKDPADDLELVRMIQNGDREQYAILYRRYYRQVYLLALRVLSVPADAEEAAGESFLKAYEKIGTFRCQSAFYTWLYRIAMNESLNMLKKRGRLVSADGAFAPGTGRDGSREETGGGPRDRVAYERYKAGDCGSFEDVEQQVIREERARILREALAELTLEDRLIVSLKYEQDLHYEEIAEVLKLPRNTVGSRLFRARKSLAAKLQERGLDS